jgi:mono/diheme cytochrome c family protein
LARSVSAGSLRLAITTAAMVLFGPSHPAGAESYHRGMVEYEVACMPCHGIDGRGDGRLAPTLKTRPADLTQIARSNKGRFPAARIAAIIDGRDVMAAHGQREMPIWGDRYRKPIPGEKPAMAEKRVRAQINALIDYLKSIQK